MLERLLYTQKGILETHWNLQFGIEAAIKFTEEGSLTISTRRFRVAILGTGNIGTDLLYKVRRSKSLKCSFFVGRREDSPGLRRAQALGISALTGGIDELMKHLPDIDLVFDATSARDHLSHAPVLLGNNCHVINLTPARLGDYYVPDLSDLDVFGVDVPLNLNMITCGGQTTIPIIIAIKRSFPKLDRVEIVSTISSLSAGPATRRNLDEYIENTESAIQLLTGISRAKVILILNPAKPEIVMHTSIYFSDINLEVNTIQLIADEVTQRLQVYCPGYALAAQATQLNSETVHLAVTVIGAGDYLPTYAGNLDIINVAAIRAAEDLARIKALV